LQQLKIEVIKKVILILILLTTLTNVSYASFPVTENLQTEIVAENIEMFSYGNRQSVWGILSFIFAVVGGLFYFTPYGLSGWMLAILAIVFGAIGFKDKPNGLAIAGFIVGVLVVIMPIIIWAFLLA
jgi:hypothetical protein|tara:strand:+ start:2185 stop:2565 length:381 start_codon:yes stop_codon:yes gene_type:complete